MTWTDDFRGHARREAPREACGFLVHGDYRPCRNVAEHEDDFRIHPKDQLAYGDEAEGICHSHPRGPGLLSPSDRATMALLSRTAKNLPWHLLDMVEDRIYTFTQAPVPLVGRTFHFGSQDCYVLARDWYAQELGIPIPWVDHEDGFEARGENPFMDLYGAFGFAEVHGPPLYGDLILMALGAKIPNHVAVCTGNAQILHHLRGRLSGHEAYGHFYQKATRHILRHVSKIPGA